MQKYVVNGISLEEEYKKPTGITPEDIGKLRQWLHTQPHLPHDHITDLDLILALHSCSLCMNSTKKLLDTHYTMKTKFNAIFKDRRVDDKTEMSLNRMLLYPISARTKNENAVLYTGLLDTDVKNFLLLESLRSLIMLLELWQYEEGTWPGLVIVYDLSSLKFGHIFKLEMDAVRQFLTFLEEAMFVKIKGIHLLNAPYFLDYIMALVKRFVRSELVDVFTIHQKGSRTIESYVDITTLPKEAGGSHKTFEECKEETLLKMTSNKEFFVQENKKRVNEALRPDAIDLDGAKTLPKKCDIEGSDPTHLPVVFNSTG